MGTQKNVLLLKNGGMHAVTPPGASFGD